jgi:hypothetical protein
MHFSSKLGLLDMIRNAFIVVIQWYIAQLIWTNTASNITNQSFEDFMRLIILT